MLHKIIADVEKELFQIREDILLIKTLYPFNSDLIVDAFTAANGTVTRVEWKLPLFDYSAICTLIDVLHIHEHNDRLITSVKFLFSKVDDGFLKAMSRTFREMDEKISRAGHLKLDMHMDHSFYRSYEISADTPLHLLMILNTIEALCTPRSVEQTANG